MQRLTIGVVAGIVLVLAAATGVSAYWHAQQRLDLSTTASGDLSISTVWNGGTTWPAIGPRQTALKHVRVTVSSSGTTMQSRLLVSTAVAAPAAPYVSAQHTLDDCTPTPGTSIPASGYPGQGSLRDGQVVDICVRLTLSSDAPSSLQGADLAPVVTIRAEQRSGQ